MEKLTLTSKATDEGQVLTVNLDREDESPIFLAAYLIPGPYRGIGIGALAYHFDGVKVEDFVDRSKGFEYRYGCKLTDLTEYVEYLPHQM